MAADPPHPDPASLIEVRDVQFGYGEQRLLAGVSFHLDAGEFVALVGPNGSGKSTLVRLITRVLNPGSGAITVCGDALESLKPMELAKRLAVVPQDTSLDFDFTAFEVALMGRTPHLGPWGRESTHDLDVTEKSMVSTHTMDFASRSIRSLSGGERQRVIVARALAQEPRALLLDEPTAHLDVNHQVDILALARDFARSGGGVLAVLHDLNLAAAFADRVLMLHAGKIAAEGPPSEVITPERVNEVFGARSVVISHPTTGRPVVLIESGGS